MNANKRATSRRRFLTVSAMGMVGVALPGLATRRAAAREAGLREWRWEGILFGAAAELTFFVREPKEGRDLTRGCVAEMRRLETIFSIYLEHSALRRLNAAGELAGAPVELVELMLRSREISRGTGGVFDVTVQPLWALYNGHFARYPDAESGPPETELERVRERVGWKNIAIDEERIRFLKPGMAVTLNGIAQGYITDRVAALLRDAGAGDVLVNIGEYRAAGEPEEGEPWRVGIRSAESAFEILDAVELRDRALAVSAGYGWTFDRAERFHHLIHPSGRGAFADAKRSVAVEAPDATLADALATACGVSGDDAAREMVRGYPGVELRVYRNGSTSEAEESGADL